MGKQTLALKLRKLLLAAGVVAALATGLGAQAIQAVQAAPAHPRAAAPPTINVQSCTGGSFCLATGDKPGHGFNPFIEEWTGKAWRIIPKPSGYTGTVTCGGPSFCLALTSQPEEAVSRCPVERQGLAEIQPAAARPGHRHASPLRSARPRIKASAATGWRGTARPGSRCPAGSGCGGAWCAYDNFGCASATDCWSSGNYCGDSDCDNGTFIWNDIWNGTACGSGCQHVRSRRRRGLHRAILLPEPEPA